ncbi:hypothetical protein J0A71_06g13900 [Encephalitozoon cuniculi]|nr:hypothetical protein J0A71_06g13900 [Encephalitozoon cuniculi]
MASAKLLMLVFTMTYAFVFYTLAIRVSCLSNL